MNYANRTIVAFYNPLHVLRHVSCCCVRRISGVLGTKEKENGFQNQDNDADKYFEPLEVACDTRHPRLMEIALDALHFLIGIFRLRFTYQIVYFFSVEIILISVCSSDRTRLSSRK